MGADKGKKQRSEEVEEEQNGAELVIDGELLASIEKLQGIQDDLEKVILVSFPVSWNWCANLQFLWKSYNLYVSVKGPEFICFLFLLLFLLLCRTAKIMHFIVRLQLWTTVGIIIGKTWDIIRWIMTGLKYCLNKSNHEFPLYPCVVFQLCAHLFQLCITRTQICVIPCTPLL